MKKRPRPTDGGGNWMDTYGDLVTLLLTFFVMLYSMSSLNEQKWEVFVRSIFPTSTEKVEDVSVNSPVAEESADELTGTVKIDAEMPEPIEVDTLYLTLAQRMDEIGIDGVTISRGEDYTFIVFEDKTFFDGDSSVLTEQGKATLDVFCDVIAPASEQLSQINIMGHTAQGDPNKPNNPRTDRMLSAMRGAEVCIFIQARDVIAPEKLVTTSYGQFRPVDTSETREGRAKNRRVELLLIDEGADVRSMNEYYEEYNSGVNADTTVITDGQPEGAGHGFAPAQPSAEGVSSGMSPVSDYVEETAAETVSPGQAETVPPGSPETSPAQDSGTAPAENPGTSPAQDSGTAPAENPEAAHNEPEAPSDAGAAPGSAEGTSE